MLNRVLLNGKKGKHTHVFIDEFHVVFVNRTSCSLKCLRINRTAWLSSNLLIS